MGDMADEAESAAWEAGYTGNPKAPWGHTYAPSGRKPTTEYSKNERAEALMGRRLTPEQESGEAPGVLPFDLGPELGYQCPVHKLEWDEDLIWSEYNGFLWCGKCNRDYPSALCVPIDAEPDPERDWRKAGPGAAIEVFLDTVEAAIRRSERIASETAKPQVR
jgi:hypothetical protein